MTDVTPTRTPLTWRQFLRACRLRFDDPDMEAGFRQTSTEASVMRMRWGAALAAVFLALFAYFDVRFYPSSETAWLLAARAMCILILAVGFALTFARRSERFAEAVGAVVVALSGLCICAMLIVASPPHVLLYHGGVLIAVFFGYIGLGLRLHHASAACLILSLFYILGSIFLFKIDIYAFQINSVHLVVTNSIGIVAGYLLERERRRAFALSRSLKQKHDELVTVNQTLEQRVALRVAQADEASERYRQEALERRQAERELRDERDLVNSILGAMNDALIVFDPKTRIPVRWNAAVSRLSGYGDEKIAQMRVPDDWLAPTVCDAVRRQVHDFQVDSGELLLLELRDAAGTLVPVEFSGGIVYRQDNTPLEMMIGRDIRNRLAVQRELATSRRRLEVALRSADLCLWEFQWQDGYLFADVRCDEIFGIDSGPMTMRLRRILRSIYWEDRQGVVDAFRQHIRGGETIRLLFRVGLERDTQWVGVSGAVAERDEQGRPLRTVGILRDATHEHLVQEQLRQAGKMEAIGRLAGGVAHDFNNLLTVINGYSEMGLMDLSEEDPMRELLELILDQGQRATNLTRQLLTFSRRQDMLLETLDVSELIQDFHKLLSRLIGEDVTLLYDLDPQLPKVRVDRTQLEQVVMNLAINARDAMPQGGVLTVSTRPIQLTQTRSLLSGMLAPGPYVVLSVADSGIGMSQEVMDHLFEPFFTTKSMGAGTGLGLAVVYGVIERLGGGVDVTSHPNKGTLFEVFVPATEEVDALPQADQENVACLGHERILLVEDEAAVRALVARWLERWGYDITQASNGQEALSLAMAEKQSMDLLLTDVVMPQLTGNALADQLTAHWPDLKTIFMSGYNDRLLQSAVGPNQRFLHKPLHRTELAQALRELLGR